MPQRLGTLLGAAQAEADALMLRQAFIETADYQALFHTTDFNFVVGRRGTGKSAIFQRLKTAFRTDSDVVLLADEPQDYEMLELQALLRSVSTDYRVLRPITRLLWTAHLLLESTRAVSTHYKFGKSLKALFLSDYLKKHGLSQSSSGTAHCTRILKSVTADAVQAEEVPRAIATRYDIGQLGDALQRAMDHTGVRVIAMYDRLDESWVPETVPVAVLGGLAKTAAEQREKRSPIYPILFIRDNMFRALAQLDDDFTRHIEGHSLRLQWDEESLLHLVVARLRVAFALSKVEAEVKVWNRFAQRELHERDGFAKCLKYTLYRPRDILVLLNAAYVNALRDGREAVIGVDIEKTAISISQNRLEDLCKEYAKVLPGLRLFVKSFRGQSAVRPLEVVAAQLESAARSSDYSNTASRDLVLFDTGGEMFSALYSVGFIGVKDDSSGNYMFCHDGTMAALVSLAGTRETLVHPCYWKALDVAVEEEPREVVIQVNDEYATPVTKEAVALRLKRLGRLPEELAGLAEGHAGSKGFETWVLRAVRLLFSGALANIELKPNPSAGLSQRDVVGTNATTTAFWKRIHADYGSRQVLFECKNYRELTPDDFRQVLDYLTGEYGRFCVVVRRGADDALTEAEKDRVKARFHEHGRVIMVLPAPIAALCIRKLRTPKKYDYTEFTISKHMDYIIRSVISMSHPPRYKSKRRK